VIQPPTPLQNVLFCLFLSTCVVQTVCVCNLYTMDQGRNQLISSGRAKWCNLLLHHTNTYVCENFGGRQLPDCPLSGCGAANDFVSACKINSIQLSTLWRNTRIESDFTREQPAHSFPKAQFYNFSLMHGLGMQTVLYELEM